MTVSDPAPKRLIWPPMLPESEPLGCVYAIQEANAPGTPIKIGWAIKPNRRIAQLQIGSPRRLCLLAVMTGGKRDERDMHKALNYNMDARLHGEWFNPVWMIGTFFRWGERKRARAGLLPMTPVEEQFDQAWRELLRLPVP